MELTPNGEGTGLVSDEVDSLGLSCLNHLLDIKGIDGKSLANGRLILYSNFYRGPFPHN
jgi:hypothetical protein